MHGYQWLTMHGHCGYQWLWMVISGYMHGYCGYAWLSVANHAWLLWLSVVMHDYQCLVHDLVVFKVGGIKALSSVFN